MEEADRRSKKVRYRQKKGDKAGFLNERENKG
jgi:hypothetical protein